MFASVTLNITILILGFTIQLLVGFHPVEGLRSCIFEDDIVVSPYFLDYMQSALDLYAKKKLPDSCMESESHV